MKSVLRSAEFGATLALLITSILFLADALKLPGGEFDPLGPGAAPEMVASVLVVLCVIVLVRSVYRLKGNRFREQDRNVGAEEGVAHATPRALLLFFGLLVAYILAFHFEVAHFIVITTVFVFLGTISLRGWDKRSALIAALVAVGLAVFLFLALTRFFVIRLPGAF